MISSNYILVSIIIYLSLIVFTDAQEMQRSNRETILDMKTDDYSNDIGLGGEHELTRLEARRIARQAGMVDFEMVTRRGNHVVVDGMDGNGDALTVIIDRHSGRVAEVKH